MRFIAVVLTVILMLGIASMLVGCKDSATEAGGDEGGMTTKELKKRGPTPPTGKKGGSGGGASTGPGGPKSGE